MDNSLKKLTIVLMHIATGKMENHSQELITCFNSANLLIKQFPFTLNVPFHDYSPITKLFNQSHTKSENSSRLSLRLMHIRGVDAFPVIDVYLNTKPDSIDEKSIVGSLALFGLRKNSDTNADHGGIGLHEIWDVTEAFFHAKETSNWLNNQFSLTFIPRTTISENNGLTLERVELWVVFVNE